MKNKTMWMIYNPKARPEDLRLFATKKAAQAEWDRIYSGAIGKLVKKHVPSAAKITKVTIHLEE